MEPRQGVPPCTARLTSASGGPAGGLSPRAGVPGKSAPDTLPAGLGRSGRVKGPCPRPCGWGRTNPLTRPPLEKRARGRAGAWRGTVGWMGSRLAQRPRSSLALTPRNDPNAPGWWLGCSSPSRLPRGERPGEAAGGALDLLLLRAVSEKHLSAPSARRTRFGSGSEHCKRSLRKCALASLRGLVRRHPVGASRGFTR